MTRWSSRCRECGWTKDGVWSCDFAQKGNSDGLYKQVMGLRKVEGHYISRSHDWPGKGFLMAYISDERCRKGIS